jgi:hypothetical protein
MTDQEYEAILSNYRREKEEEQRREIEASANVIHNFRAHALTKGVTLSDASSRTHPLPGFLPQLPGSRQNSSMVFRLSAMAYMPSMLCPTNLTVIRTRLVFFETTALSFWHILTFVADIMG